MIEEYRTLEGLDDRFMISNLGKVIGISGKQLKLQENKKGYKFVFIRKSDGKNTPILLHRLVARAFPEICGEWFEGCIVHHKDHDKDNNKADNLIIMSKIEHNDYHKESEITQDKVQEKVAKYDLNYNLLCVYNSVNDCIKDNSINKKTWGRYMNGNWGRCKYRFIKLNQYLK